METIIGILIVWLIVRWSLRWYLVQCGLPVAESSLDAEAVIGLVEHRWRHALALLMNHLQRRFTRPRTLQAEVLEADVVAEAVMPPPIEEGPPPVVDIVDEEESQVVVTPVYEEEIPDLADDEIPHAIPPQHADADEAIPAPVFLYVEAYCPTCRTQRPLVDPEEALLEDGQRGMRGICPICHGELFVALDE